MIQALLLAAGSGRRFGGDKLLATLGDGTPLVVASAGALLAAGCAVLAVVRPGAAGAGVTGLLASLPGVRVRACARAADGLGASLACGVAASPRAAGWLVALGDMPAIRPATIARVLATLADGAPIVAPALQGRRGHPVGFGAAFRDALLACHGDQGARDLLAREAARLTLIDVDDPGVLCDVDHPTDLAALRDARVG